MVTILNHTIVYIYISTHYILRPLNSEYILIIVITSLLLVPKNGGRSYSVGAFPIPGSCDIPWRKRWRRSEPGREGGCPVFSQCFGRLDTLFDLRDCGRLWDIVGYYGIFGQFVDIDIVTTKGHGFLMSFLGMTLSFSAFQELQRWFLWFLEVFTGGDLTRWARWDMCRTWGSVFLVLRFDSVWWEKRWTNPGPVW